MEVSVDFRPKTPSDEARARMVGVLFRHLAPTTELFSSHEAMPRYSWGQGKRCWARVQESRGSDHNDPYRFAVNDVSNAPGADTTVYFGSKDASCMVRVMDKVVDRQNTFAGTSEALEPKMQRCRVEVTLKQTKLETIGVRQLQDLPHFKFAKLQGLYFQFKLATVLDPIVRAGPVSVYREKQRFQKFLSAGISGLAKMDQTILDHSTALRTHVRKEMVSRKKHLPSLPRTGSGPYGTAVAYEQLCKKVQTALANLSRKLSDEERKGDL